MDGLFGKESGIKVREGTQEEAEQAVAEWSGKEKDKRAELKDAAGQVKGWWDRENGEVVLFQGADIRTVAHEIGWHAVRQWAEKNSQELLAKMNGYAESCPKSLRRLIEKRYAGFTGDALLDEIGAGRFERELGDEFRKLLETRPQVRSWWRKVCDAIRQMLKGWSGKGNGIDLKKIEKMAPEEAMRTLAERMLEGGRLAGQSQAIGTGKRASISGVKRFNLDMKPEDRPEGTAERSEKVNATLRRLEEIQRLKKEGTADFYKKVNEEFGADYTFDLGKPYGMLGEFLEAKPVQLKMKTLLRKKKENYKSHHPFTFEEAQDVVTKMNEPAIILRRQNDKEGIRAFYEANTGRIFCVSVRPTGEVYDVETLYPKEVKRLAALLKTMRGRTDEVLGVDTPKAISMFERQYDTTQHEQANGLADAISILKQLAERKGENAEIRPQIGGEDRSAGGAERALAALVNGRRRVIEPLNPGAEEMGEAGLRAGEELWADMRLPRSAPSADPTVVQPVTMGLSELARMYRAVTGSLPKVAPGRRGRVKGRLAAEVCFTTLP